MTDSNPQPSTEDAAATIRELLAAGQTEEQIRADRPDLEAGWANLSDSDQPAKEPVGSGSFGHVHASETFRV